MNKIDKYLSLITRFTNGEISASQFESDYLDMFKNEKDILPEDVYDILNDLFLDVDAFCGDSDLRDDEDLDEEELLSSAKKALKKLT